MTHTTPAASGELITEARLGSLPELLAALTTRRARQLDFVAPADKLRFANGQLVIDEIPAQIGPGGVSQAEPGGVFAPLRAFDGLLASRLGIPAKWLAYCRENRLDVWDQTANAMLHGGTGADGRAYPGYPKKLLVRTFKGEAGTPGWARAVLSDGYNPIDHLDVLAVTAKTITEMADKQIRAALREALGLPFADEEPLTDADRAVFAGLYPDGQVPGIAGGYQVHTINLTEDAMHLRIFVPGIEGTATVMAAGYRDPFRRGGARRWDGSARPRPKRGDLVNPFVDVVNNEIGKGSYLLIPGYERVICANGMTEPKWAVRTQHLGGRLAEGEVVWAEDTQRSELKTVLLKTRDALRRFLDPGFLAKLIKHTEERAGVEVADPAATIEVVQQACAFTDGQAADILRMFTLGGQLTAGGIANAVTAASQVTSDPEAAMMMDHKAMEALHAAADFAEAQAGAAQAQEG